VSSEWRKRVGDGANIGKRALRGGRAVHPRSGLPTQAARTRALARLGTQPFQGRQICIVIYGSVGMQRATFLPQHRFFTQNRAIPISRPVGQAGQTPDNTPTVNAGGSMRAACNIARWKPDKPALKSTVVHHRRVIGARDIPRERPRQGNWGRLLGSTYTPHTTKSAQPNAPPQVSHPPAQPDNLFVADDDPMSMPPAREYRK
jgi:hypothetical protein